MSVENAIKKLDFEKGNGLIPVVVQDHVSLEVIMFAYANEEALKKTIETDYAHYFSRSRQSLWKKGETSGNLQKMKDILFDCDSDTLLYKVEQIGGAACHTGRRSCFFNRISNEGLELEFIPPIEKDK
ncbi:MAG: phosphoribosyl-AMP cyclohydrolase [Planctomycetota bacterium]|nr:MAG: phosphoribosyl-AMP cyclohydrolase [Planctomycetota bacterium]